MHERRLRESIRLKGMGFEDGCLHPGSIDSAFDQHVFGVFRVQKANDSRSSKPENVELIRLEPTARWR
jgi:hypothetical protein